MFRMKPHLFATGLLLLLILFLFGDILFSGDSRIFSFLNSDIHLLFAHWRQFGFEEMAKGNLPLWNPYIYNGAPFFESFQAGPLYPPKWMYIVLPLPVAINIDMVLHLVLPEIFVYSWTQYRKSHQLSCLLAATITILSGSHYLRLCPGHLPHLAAMAWIPLIFLCVDGILQKFRYRWLYLGSFAYAMQILAGFPQYVYYTFIMNVLFDIPFILLITVVMGILFVKFPIAADHYGEAYILEKRLRDRAPTIPDGANKAFFSFRVAPWDGQITILDIITYIAYFGGQRTKRLFSFLIPFVAVYSFFSGWRS